MTRFGWDAFSLESGHPVDTCIDSVPEGTENQGSG